VSVTVRTQTELNAALKAGEATIHIESSHPAGVWLALAQTGSSHVVARESSHVVARGSSHVEAWESSHVEARGSSHVEARGSSHVVARESSHVEARGSSHVEARESSHVEARGSSHVEAGGSSHVAARESSHVEARESSHVVARESSHVVARESSHVEAWESSHVVAAPYVAVHLHSQRVTFSGGVVIDMTAIDESDPQTWCDLHGVTVKRGVASLFKALDADLRAGHAYTKTEYAVGKRVTAADWRDDGECGGGLHLGPTTSHATDYRSDATRWVRVEVKVADLRPIVGGTAKCKVKSCKVVAEVDRWGVEVEP
jgi:hypothetical protein